MNRFGTSAGLVGAAILLSAGIASATTYTVTSTADAGAGTLRQAITDANASLGPDTIAFNIIGSGVHTIVPATLLPPITDAVTIDGYTQPGSVAQHERGGPGLNTVLKIEIAGTGTRATASIVEAINVTIRGLAINRFSLDQVERELFRSALRSRRRRLLPRVEPGRASGYSGGGGVACGTPARASAD